MTNGVTSPPEGGVRDPDAPGTWLPPGPASSWHRAPTWWVLVGALVAVLVRLPYLRAPMGADEGGFLLVAAQWRSGGSSLYGDYWVDRPPLLIGFFAAADKVGGTTALRLMGCALAFALVVLAHLLGREVSNRVAPSSPVSPWPAVAALALVSMPLTGAQEVNGELIALPLVLGGLLAALRHDGERDPTRRLLWWASAGALGTAAAMVKQNFLDVFVFGIVLLAATTWTRRHGSQNVGRDIGRVVGRFAALLSGGVLVGGATLLGAASRGTGPGGLWDALVVFRLHAGAVIAHSASSATHDRLLRLLLMACLSGSIAVIVAFAAHARRRTRQPLAVATVALLCWELVGLLGGGSYWLHYLLGLVPGLVLAVAQLTSRSDRLGVTSRAVVTYTAAVAVITTPAALVISPPDAGDPPAAVWLEHHARSGDTATVLYGAPNILQAAGLASPYPQLWSLPVRIRDPQLTQLQVVLTGTHPPTWLLASHGLATWGVSAGTAHAEVRRRYEPVAAVDGYTVYHLRAGVTAIREGPAATGLAAIHISGTTPGEEMHAPTSTPVELRSHRE